MQDQEMGNGALRGFASVAGVMNQNSSCDCLPRESRVQAIGPNQLDNPPSLTPLQKMSRTTENAALDRPFLIPAFAGMSAWVDLSLGAVQEEQAGTDSCDSVAGTWGESADPFISATLLMLIGLPPRANPRELREFGS